MEIFNDKVELDENNIEITIFQNYGDQLERFGVPTILEGFWVFITVRRKDETPTVGFPVTEMNVQFRIFDEFETAIGAARARIEN